MTCWIIYQLCHVWLEIKQTNSKSFLLCIVYRHPYALSSWKDLFEINMEKAQFEDKEILIMGDINKDLNNDRIKREWTNYITSLGLTQLIDSQHENVIPRKL